MKELTIEQKAKAYDDAKARMSRAFNSNRCTIGFMNEIFPELAESEDEKIRKELIQFIKNWKDHNNICHQHDFSTLTRNVEQCDRYIAWLEKQKEFVSVDFDNVWETADCDELTAPLDKYSKDAIKKMCHAWYDKGIELERKSCLGKQSEQKSADDVETKFHVNEWVVTSINVVQIKAVNNGHYIIDNGMEFNMPYVDKYWHKWTIKDAKPGDVLSWDDSKCIALFKNIYDEESFNSYGLVGHCTGTFELRQSYHDIEGAHPATKEQRDLFFTKMKEAGYEWDTEKKELKKIEKESTWNEKIKGLNELETYILSLVPDRSLDTIKVDAKNIRYIINKEQKSAWNEEDNELNKELITAAICFIDNNNHDNEFACNRIHKDDVLKWLKSLK